MTSSRRDPSTLEADDLSPATGIGDVAGLEIGMNVAIGMAEGENVAPGSTGRHEGALDRGPARVVQAEFVIGAGQADDVVPATAVQQERTGGGGVEERLFDVDVAADHVASGTAPHPTRLADLNDVVTRAGVYLATDRRQRVVACTAVDGTRQRIASIWSSPAPPNRTSSSSRPITIEIEAVLAGAALDTSIGPEDTDQVIPGTGVDLHPRSGRSR